MEALKPGPICGRHYGLTKNATCMRAIQLVLLIIAVEPPPAHPLRVQTSEQGSASVTMFSENGPTSTTLIQKSYF
jgi:hypothetical protein